jgi:uncharacterized membrane protein
VFKSKMRTRPNASCGRSKPPVSIPLPLHRKGAVGGAAVGAAIGAIAGNAGKGAAIGAVTGTAGGGLRQRRMNEAAASQQQANQQQVSQEMSTYNRAVGACMTGRGYSIQ